MLEHPDAHTQRTLTLLAKVIQALGNLAEFGAKEHFIMTMNGFIRVTKSCAKVAELQ